jgi:ABC-type glycerol-3-phosphate transport system permease component
MSLQALTRNPNWQMVWVSVIGAAVLSVLAAYEFSRREFFD